MKKLYTIILLSLISLWNAIYLTNAALKYKNWVWEKLFCDVSDTLSCSNLFTFDFAWFWPIPFPMIAMLVYPIIAIIAYLWLKWKIKNHFKIISIIALMWMCFNWYIIFNEFVVWVFCLACLACSVAITTIAWISLYWNFCEKK